MPAAIPYAPPGSMSSTKAAYTAKCGRKLMRAGRLSHRTFAVLDTLLWDVRAPGSDRAVVSYSGIEKLARVCRQSVATAIKELVTCRLVRKIKHKTLTLWANGGRKWRQRPNEYVFHCESAGLTEYPKEGIQILRIEPSPTEIHSAEATLAARRRLIEARLLTKGRGPTFPAP